MDYYNNNYYDGYRQPQPPFGPGFGLFPGFPGFVPPFGGPGGGPGFGPPFGGGPGGPGFGPPFGGGPGGGQMGPPSGPPPSFTPQQSQAQSVGLFAVDPGAIRPCTFRYIYIWPTFGRPFWAWLVFVGRRSVAGWRWTGFNWRYFGMDLDNIESFVCY